MKREDQDGVLALLKLAQDPAAFEKRLKRLTDREKQLNELAAKIKADGTALIKDKKKAAEDRVEAERLMAAITAKEADVNSKLGEIVRAKSEAVAVQAATDAKIAEHKKDVKSTAADHKATSLELAVREKALAQATANLELEQSEYFEKRKAAFEKLVAAKTEALEKDTAQAAEELKAALAMKEEYAIKLSQLKKLVGAN